MIELVGVPLLMKAVDFLFVEGHKIVQERRERRRAEQNINENEPADPIKNAKEILQTKTEVVQQKISEKAIENHEKEIEHLLSLAEIHAANYRLAKEQYAKWGSALVPPIIANNLKESEDAVQSTVLKLHSILNRLTGKHLIIPQ